MNSPNQDLNSIGSTKRRLRVWTFLLPVIVVCLGVFLALALIRSAPKAELRPPNKQPRLVETSVIEFSAQQVMVEAMGTVIPARQIEIKPRVNGLIASVSDNFVPGGRLQSGDTLLTLDSDDFELLVRDRKSNLDQAKSELALEMGRQKFARQEYALRRNDVSEEDAALMLRAPQLATAEAAVEKAEIALQQAQLNLQRSVIPVPFNALVRQRMVDVGVQVTTASSLAVLSETDRFWLQLSVPVDKLPWITIPDDKGKNGSVVRIYNDAAWGKGHYRNGQVIRLTGDLEEEGRMARLLVEIEDPLALSQENSGEPIVLLGSYLRVVIEGMELDSVVELDRRLLHNGDYIWLMDDSDELVVQPIEVLFRGPDSVLVKEGINAGERIITSALSAPVAGMKLRKKPDSEL